MDSIPTDPLKWVEGTGVRVDLNVEGMKVEWTNRMQYMDPRDFNGIILGGRAGPQVHVSNLLHEMAHFIEIDDERCTRPGWGLHIRQVYLMGKSYNDPNTYQATLREARVGAIQLELAEFFGVKYDADEPADITEEWIRKHTLDAMDLATTFHRFMPDSVHAYRRFRIKIGAKDYEKRAYACLAKEIEKRRERLYIEYLWSEFRRKCGIHDRRLAKAVRERARNPRVEDADDEAA
jgi:hypothetical protein